MFGVVKLENIRKIIIQGNFEHSLAILKQYVVKMQRSNY